MPSLSLIATESQRLLKHVKEANRDALQEELADLCEVHWHELRGPQPTTPLALAMWSITPSWSDLLLDLYAAGDARLTELLPGSSLTKGLALLVLAEIERGNEAGVYIAYEPMMAFETTPPPANWLEHITSLLRGTLEPPVLHRHDSHESLWKALAVMTAHTRRLDLPAALQVITLLTTSQDQAPSVSETSLETLRHDTLEIGIRFLSVEDNHINLEQHGHAHKPVRIRQVGEMLLEIRKKWLR